MIINKLKSAYHFLDDKLRIVTYPLRMQPSFIVVGVQKGGSSSLFHYLIQHPHILPPRRKELRYFDLHYENGSNWYQSRFPLRRNGFITGEASPDYLFNPFAPERIKNYDPNIKLVVVLRDPIERAYSHFQMEIRKGRQERVAFDTAIEYELKNIHRFEINSFDFKYHTYLSRGKYFEQLTLWLKYFSADQLLIMNSDRFFANPQQELDKVCDYLGIDCFSPRNLQARNVGNYSPIEDSLRDTLKEYYREDTAQLVRLLGDDFDWYSSENKK